MEPHCIELLETRIAPAAVFVNANIGTYTDEDGDIVTVRFSKPGLDPSNIASILVTTPRGGGDHLDKINLSGITRASGVDIIVKTRVAGNGDGLANVGILDATGVDLGTVTIHGDLGQILVGDSVTSTRAIKSLNLHTFGVADTIAGNTLGASNVLGSLGALVVTGDMASVNFGVSASAAADATIGNIFIGGSLRGGSETFSGVLFAKGDMGSVTIRGSVVGGKSSSGIIVSDSGSIGSLRIGGSLRGGAEANSGFVFAASIGSVAIGRNVVGGDGDHSGQIFGANRLGPVSIGGSLYGGAGASSGRITTNGVIASVFVGGSVIGGASSETGSIDSGTALGPVRIGGSLIGGSASSSGVIASVGNIGPVTIGGDIFGGGTDNTIVETGEIRSFSGSIASVRIGGNAISGFGSFNGCILAEKTLGPVAIVGEIDSYGDGFFLIRAGGLRTGNAIASLAVGGSVSSAVVLAGYTANNVASNGNASIGPVTVGGNWIGSSIAAGVENPLLFLFGDGGDSIIVGSTAVSRIASIAIGGFIRGSTGGTDHYGFVAQQIGSVTVAGSVIPLSPSAHTDNRLIGLTGDFRIHEV